MNHFLGTVIVDDQPACIDVLCNDLAAFPDVRVVGSASSALEAKKLVLTQQPRLMFLDIEMPHQNGIEFLREMLPLLPGSLCVVFYSAFDKYMLNAMRASAFDFLLKPYQTDELSLILDRVREKLSAGQTNIMQTGLRKLESSKRLAIHTVTGLLLLHVWEIIYFRYSAGSRSWHVMLSSFVSHKLSMNTRACDIVSLSSSFIQVSKDCILNIEYLCSIENETYRCSLYPPYNNVEICSTRRYCAKIREALEII